MKIISIEGNIGSGKSTFVETLKKYYKNPKIYFLQEPVEEWNTIKDKDGISILENYYKDQKKYAFSFQMMAYISRLSSLKNAIDANKYDYIITERSLFTDKEVFCKMLYDDGFIEEIEYTIYLKWFNEFIPKCEISYVYLYTDTIVSFNRIEKRNRKGEDIPIEYLEKCKQYHDNWLTDNCILINSNKNRELTLDSMNELIKYIVPLIKI